MKVLSVLAVAVLLAMPSFYGCAPAPAPEPVKHEVVPVKQKQILSVTIIEGKTTRREIVDALGTPASISSEFFRYGSNKDDVLYQIHLTDRNGIQFNLEKESFVVRFDERKNFNIVREVGIH